MPSDKFTETSRQRAKLIAEEYYKQPKDVHIEMTPKIHALISVINEVFACDVMANTRLYPVPDAKKVLLNHLLELGYGKYQIAKFIGRDRTNCFAMLKRYEDLIETDKQFSRKVENVRLLLSVE
jgi:hypothetical protein